MSMRGPPRASIKPPNVGIQASTTSRKSNQMVSVASKNKANVASSNRSVLMSSTSRKGLPVAGEGLRSVIQPRVQIIDEVGQDVTPRPLHYVDPSVIRKNMSNRLADGSVGTPTDLMSQASFYQTGTVQSASTYGGGPFTRSVFSQSQSEAGESLSEDMAVADHTSQDIEPAWAEIRHIRDEVKEELTEDDLEKTIDVHLEETDTIWLLDIVGTCVSLETDEAAIVKERNDKYNEICKSRVGNDLYVEREMNTFNDAPKYKLIQTNKIQYNDIGITATTWDMYDSFKAITDAEAKEKDSEMEVSGSQQGSRPVSSKEKSEETTTADAGTDPVSRENTRTESRATFMSSQLGSEVAGSVRDKITEPAEEEKLKREAEEKILKSSEFRMDLVVMERVVNLNTFQPKQASYRHFDIIPDIDKVVVEEPAQLIESVGPMLDKLWAYSCPLTKGRNISCLSWNKVNQDLVAVGYGEYDFSAQKGGLVCCWSLKNPEYPERVYTSDQGITAMDFSLTHPNLLAVGLYDGTIAIYNVRSSKNEAVLDSFESGGKHIGPVWQLKWIEKERGSDERTEVLVSVSNDGRVTQWSIRKGFECADLMKMKRLASKITNIGKAGKEKKADSLISRQAGGCCFDFMSKDPNIYLAGTEEGHIHKCSCSYNEQFLETYQGHNGPIYKLKWSPYVPDVFLSSSGDWTIKLWHHDIPYPVISFISSTKSVYDICWSPRSSTMFAAVNEGAVEVWDLKQSVLDPIIVNTPMEGIKLTTVSFAQNSESILVGDSEGHVTVYQLRGMAAASKDNQVEILKNIVEISLASQLNKPETSKDKDDEDEDDETNV